MEALFAVTSTADLVAEEPSDPQQYKAGAAAPELQALAGYTLEWFDADSDRGSAADYSPRTRHLQEVGRAALESSMPVLAPNHPSLPSRTFIKAQRPPHLLHTAGWAQCSPAGE